MVLSASKGAKVCTGSIRGISHFEETLCWPAPHKRFTLKQCHTRLLARCRIKVDSLQLQSGDFRGPEVWLGTSQTANRVGGTPTH